MKILGIDPGIGRTGWGVVTSKNNNFINPKYGCIDTSPDLSTEKRLSNIYDEVEKIIKLHKPKQAAVEKLFFNTNAKTAMTVGEARGVILLALNKNKIAINHYTPLQIKIAVTGYGRAEKAQIQRMIKSLLDLDKIPKPDDVSDALAVAITHAHTMKLK